ncbi:MAG: cupin domain-containing protein [Candidatus Hodarchaeales archaeon]|jgi:mannose-6-phosphate isomerase-like protein (cupin superfamily)
MKFDLNTIIERVKESNIYYKSFIDEPHMDIGVLVLKPGQEDNQKPHSKDEIYFILHGDGYITIDDHKHPIIEKMFYFVRKNIKHYFSHNTKEIVVVYFFGC